MKTGAITYSVHERGRKFRGSDRNFDTVALAAVINSPEVQERVKKRDLWGYYGHWPRKVFGMNPGEGGLVERGPLAGKTIPLQPALVTTMLSADRDGNITHEAEFLDNANGRLAFRAKTNRVGGFSSAIAAHDRGGRDVPFGFYGFDYVSEPNFSTNRGYVLDGVEDDDGEYLLDSVVCESQAALRVLDGVYAALQGDYDRMAEAYQRSTAECAELVAMLASRSPPTSTEALQKLARLDSTSFGVILPTARLDSAHLSRMAADFSTLDLPAFEPAKETAEEASITRQLGGVIDAMLSRFR